MEVRCNRSRNCVLLYSRGTRITHYLGLESTTLLTLQMSNDAFDEEFSVRMKQTPRDFALAYTRDESARAMIPLSSSSIRVLAGILKGLTEISDDSETVNQLEKHMAKEEIVGFRKPDGPVAKVHAFLDKKIDEIKAGTVSRKQLIDAMVDKGLSAGTVTTQCGKWALLNGVTFVRPTQAEAVKAEIKEKQKAKAKKEKAKAAGAPRKAGKVHVTAAGAAA